jgi:hypothetical protein
MKIQRIITAEGESGVATRIDTIDTAAIQYLANIWGFDRVPDLPLRPEQVLGEYQRMGVFGPLGSLRVHLVTAAPETGEGPSALQRAATLDLGTGGGMVRGKEGDGMHRTDSFDLVVVIDGETNIGYPGEDGRVHELTIKAGDVVVHNGTFHSWHNRSTQNCSMLLIVLAAERKVPQ